MPTPPTSPTPSAPSALSARPSTACAPVSPDHLLKDPLLHEILGAGWQTVTYRQNTELMVEAWHWNPAGKWSNADKQEGYFVGNAEPTAEMIHSSWAYPLPHRGFSRGDGNGWSRLTDGDLKSYWKSNPYLTKAFTGEDDSLHPQWVMIDLGSKIDVNAIRIAWADPYAKHYAVQFWTGELEPFYDGTTKGTWQTFPLGNITEGKGGTVTLKLVSWMIPVRYIRIWMTESSNTCDTHGSADKRNCVGYAINELYAGALAADGTFNDYVTHFPSRDQTVTWPSSVDPWTASTDLDQSRGDQVGFDFFMTSGITRGLPTMVPIAMLYATPEDAANEIAYLYKRHYPISWIEMGEEADGQHMLPEDYGALYVQFATAIHKLVPEAKLGGPPFEGTFGDVEVWPDANGKVSWIGRFVDYLKAHGRLNDFTFFSFEHYPYQDRPTYSWADLYPEPGYVSHIVQVWKDNGVPPNIPFFMTEGNIGGGAPPSTVKSRPVARGLRRHHDERGRGRNLLFPLHAVSRRHGQRLREFPAHRCGLQSGGLSAAVSGGAGHHQRMGAAHRRAAQAVQGLERRERRRRKCDGHGLRRRAARRPVVGDAGQPRPVQRSRRESRVRGRRHARSFFLRHRSTASPSAPTNISGTRRAEARRTTPTRTVRPRNRP